MELAIFEKGEDAEGDNDKNQRAGENLFDLNWGIFGSSAEDDF